MQATVKAQSLYLKFFSKKTLNLFVAAMIFTFLWRPQNLSLFIFCGLRKHELYSCLSIHIPITQFNYPISDFGVPYYDDDANTTTTYGYLITKLAKLSRIFDNSFNKGMLLFQKSIFGHPTQEVPTYTHWYITHRTHTHVKRAKEESRWKDVLTRRSVSTVGHFSHPFGIVV